MKLNNSVGLFDVPAPKTNQRYAVIPRDGRFLVCRRVFGSNDTYDVIDDCRTEAFATRRVEALNEGKVSA